MIAVTHESYRFIVREQLKSVSIDSKHILIEPVGKNTASAILAASLYALDVDKDASLLVMPSDHVMPDKDALQSSILIG